MSMDEMYDPPAAGSYLGGSKPIAVQTLAIMRLRGTGPRYCKVGRQVRYRRSDLDSWTAQRMRSNTGQVLA